MSTEDDNSLQASTAALSHVTLSDDPSGRSYPPLADGTYDAIVLGTGLTECILSGILSVAGLKVLHADRNDYYGAKSASLTLPQCFDNLGGGQIVDAKILDQQGKFGKVRDYNVDLIPKFIMSGGNMVKMLLHCNVGKYLDFKLVDGSFVYTDRPHKVPVTPSEAMTSGLMGLFEKNRCRQFFSYVNYYDPNDKNTHQGQDLKTMTMEDFYKWFGLQPETISFVGHALALYRDDDYLRKPAEETVFKIQLYARSLAKHGKSPYLYPLYGLGELPQAFARLSAVHGGTFMLQCPLSEILYNSSGKAIGIRAGDEVATAKFIVGDPTYFPDKVKKVGQVARCYCILDHAPLNTKDSTSCQIIVPAINSKPKRRSDIYVLVLSDTHKVAPKGKFIALVSTTVETSDPVSELQFGVDMLGPVVHKFYSIDDVYEPLASGKDDSVYISRSYDATTHFESTVDDVFDIYKRIFGTDLVLNPKNATE